MKKKDEDAFLRSVSGTSPIIKKNRVPKDIPSVAQGSHIKVSKVELPNKTKKTAQEPTSPKSFFVLERGAINKKLKKGKIPIEKKIDFHGLSVFQAEEVFLSTVIRCYNRGLRCILFVTGKGILKKNNNESGEAKLYYGKIRKSFFTWIKKEEVQKYILSVEQAGIDHGADGAFFVYLRKKN